MIYDDQLYLSGFGSCGNPSNSWEDWCNSEEGVKLYGKGNKWVCMRDIPGPRNDGDTTGPTILGCAIPGAPWDFIGQTSRWFTAGLIPGLDEYKAIIIENGVVTGGLWQTMYKDPARFAHLAAMAQFVPGVGQAYMLGGFGLAAVEGARAYFRDYGEKMGVANAENYANDQIWRQMVWPSMSDALQLVVQMLGLGFITGMAVHGMKVESENMKNPPLTRAVMAGISQHTEIVGYLCNGQGLDNFKQEAPLRALGHAVFEGCQMIRNQNIEPELFAAIAAAGRSVEVFARPLSILISKGYGGLEEAADAACVMAFGVHLQGFKDAVGYAGAMKDALKDRDSQDARTTVTHLGEGANGINESLKGINLNWGFFTDLFAPIQQVIASITGRLSRYNEITGVTPVVDTSADPNSAATQPAVGITKRAPGAVQNAPPPITIPSVGTTANMVGSGGSPSGINATAMVSSSMPALTPSTGAARTGIIIPSRLAQGVPTAVATPTGTTSMIVPATKGSSVGAALAAAGAGFMVGGPPGAIAGLALGLFLGKK